MSTAMETKSPCLPVYIVVLHVIAVAGGVGLKLYVKVCVITCRFNYLATRNLS